MNSKLGPTSLLLVLLAALALCLRSTAVFGQQEFSHFGQRNKAMADPQQILYKLEKKIELLSGERRRLTIPQEKESVVENPKPRSIDFIESTLVV